eukprot:269096-Amphidinium_carterae.4
MPSFDRSSVDHNKQEAQEAQEAHTTTNLVEVAESAGSTHHHRVYQTPSHWTVEEQQSIESALLKHVRMADAVKEIQTRVPGFTTTDAAAKNYVSIQALRRWRRNSASSQSQLERLTIAAKSTRRPRTWQNFTVEEQQSIDAAVLKHARTTDAVTEIQAHVPGFTTADEAAKKYVAKKTLSRWCRDSASSWADEQDSFFIVANPLPSKKDDNDFLHKRLDAPWFLVFLPRMRPTSTRN